MTAMRAWLAGCFCALALPAFGEEVANGSAAELRALDRLSGELREMIVPAGGSAPLGRLSISVSECRYPVHNPAGDAYAFLIIHDLSTNDTLFSGWMVASSPALNAFDHMRYDVWVMRCSTS